MLRKHPLNWHRTDRHFGLAPLYPSRRLYIRLAITRTTHLQLACFYGQHVQHRCRHPDPHHRITSRLRHSSRVEYYIQLGRKRKPSSTATALGRRHTTRAGAVQTGIRFAGDTTSSPFLELHRAENSRARQRRIRARVVAIAVTVLHRLFPVSVGF